MNTNVPYMACSAQMYGLGNTVDPTRLNGANMIGIDFLSDAMKRCWIDDISRSPRSQRFCENHGNTPMENPCRLPGPLVNRHAPLQIVVARLDHLNAKVPVCTGSTALVNHFQIKR